MIRFICEVVHWIMVVILISTKIKTNVQNIENRLHMDKQKSEKERKIIIIIFGFIFKKINKIFFFFNL